MAASHEDEAFARFERAKQTNAKCAAQARKISDEFRQIERRKVKLVTLRKINAGTRDVWLQNLTQNTIVPYSKAWNLKFAESMQATLPPEVRNIVYGYLLDDDMWTKHGNDIQAVGSMVSPHIGHCRCMYHGQGRPRVPHFLLPEYTGGPTSLEIVEKLYSDDWFKDQTFYGETIGLQHLVHQDAFRAGYDPASRIRSLNITCNVDRHRHSPNRCAQKSSCDHNPYERRYFGQDNLKSEFDHLLGLARNKDFRCLEVTFIQRNVRIDVLEEALEAFADVYKTFRAAGTVMRIQWMYRCISSLGAPHDHSRNVGKFYSEPRLRWKYRMLQFLEKVVECIEPKHVKFINEPGLGLSDTEFVHRMWDSDENQYTTDEELSEEEDDDYDEHDEETNSGSDDESNAIYRPDGTLYAE